IYFLYSTTADIITSGSHPEEKTDSHGNQKLDRAIADQVVNYFEQDEIFLISSNKKDVIHPNQIPKTKRFMLMTIGETYVKFCKDNPDVQTNTLKFYHLRHDG
ncbi:unnamed protein product, partial [Didymodactylos carnosus]